MPELGYGLGDLNRDVATAGRGLTGGVLDTFLAPADLASFIQEMRGHEGFGEELGRARGYARSFGLYPQDLSNATARDRILSEVGAGAGMGIGAAGILRRLGMKYNPATAGAIQKAVLAPFVETPGLAAAVEIGGGMGAGAAASVAREAGVGTGAELAAGLAGGMAGSIPAARRIAQRQAGKEASRRAAARSAWIPDIETEAPVYAEAREVLAPKAAISTAGRQGLPAPDGTPRPLFHQTNEAHAEEILLGRDSSPFGNEIFLADTPLLALGQRGRKTVDITFDGRGDFNLKAVRKPASDIAAATGAGREYRSTEPGKSIAARIRSVRIKGDGAGLSSNEKAHRTRLTRLLKQRKWRHTVDGEDTVFAKPLSAADELAADAVSRSGRSGLTPLQELNKMSVPAGSDVPLVGLPGEPVSPWQAKRVAAAMSQHGDEVRATHAGNISLDNFSSGEDLRRGVGQYIEDMGGAKAYWNQRRGSRSIEETLEAAQGDVMRRLGQSPDEIVANRLAGKALNAEELAAAEITMDAAGAQVDAAWGAWRAGAENGAGDFAEALTRLGATTYEFAGASAEAGRALNVLKQLKSARNKKAAVSALLKRYGGEEQVEELGALMQALDDPAMVNAFAKAAAKSVSRGWAWNASDIWKAGLLWSPGTHKTNMFSNGLFSSVFHGIEEPVAAVAGAWKPAAKAMGLRSTSRDRVYAQEAAAQIYGLMEGSKAALRSSFRAFRGNVEWSPALDADNYKGHVLARIARTGTHSPLDRPLSVAGGKIYKAATSSFRLLTAEDALFKSSAFRARMYGLGMRDAIHNKVPIGQRLEHARKWAMDPPDSAMSDAMKRADTLTFTTPLGTTGKALQQFVNSHPMLTPLAPFIRTPLNVMKETIYRTPGVQFLAPTTTKDLMAGGARSDRAISRMLVSAGLIASAWDEIESGNITGAGPTDPAERYLYMSEGRAPFSRKVTKPSDVETALRGAVGMEQPEQKTFYKSYSRDEPYATPYGFAATMHAMKQRGELSSVPDIASGATAALAENFVAKSMLQGPTRTAGAIKDPSRDMNALIEQFSGSLIPSPINAWARARDVYRRDQRGLAPSLQARIPGEREGVPIRYDIIGRPFTTGDARDPTWRRFVAEYMSELKRDPIITAMQVSGSRVVPQPPVVEISKTEVYDLAGGDEDLLKDAQLLKGGLNVELNRAEMEWMNQTANSSAHKELMKYIPQLMKVRGTMKPVDIEKILDAGKTPEVKAYVDKLRGQGIARAFMDDAIRDLIQDAYQRHRMMQRTLVLLPAWREEGVLRKELNEQLRKQASEQKQRELEAAQ